VLISYLLGFIKFIKKINVSVTCVHMVFFYGHSIFLCLNSSWIEICLVKQLKLRVGQALNSNGY